MIKVYGLRILSIITPFLKSTTDKAATAGLEYRGYKVTKTK